MSAIFPNQGPIRQLDASSEPDEQITPEYVQDDTRLSRLLLRMLSDLFSLKRRWQPAFYEYEDRVVDATGTTPYRFPHGLKARVRWQVVDWASTAGGTGFHELEKHASTDLNTLVLTSKRAGTVTIRVEVAG